jgi:hypothetical protein
MRTVFGFKPGKADGYDYSFISLKIAFFEPAENILA